MLRKEPEYDSDDSCRYSRKKSRREITERARSVNENFTPRAEQEIKVVPQTTTRYRDLSSVRSVGALTNSEADTDPEFVDPCV
jgi:hypothetical protein